MSTLIKDLKSRNLMFKSSQFEHSYPHCWRCHTALMYYAQPSWYIKTTSIKKDLLRENSKTDWHPETIKTGRFGDWLNIIPTDSLGKSVIKNLLTPNPVNPGGGGVGFSSKKGEYGVVSSLRPRGR